MNIETLNLEITRRCTLECEHCFRGDSQNSNISEETLKNIFNNVKKIDRLVITGGEPLIAVNELEKMIYYITKYNVQIEQINLVTNGTVFGSRILKILKDLSTISKLNLFISFNIFHLLELERKNLKQKRDENVKVLKELFGAKEYGDEYEERNFKPSYQSLQPIGRAKNINQKRLAEINSMIPVKYKVLSEITWIGSKIKVKDNILTGDVCIDVNGNIVPYGLSFQDEDIYSSQFDVNINDLTFAEAINNFNSNPSLKNNSKFSI